MRIIGVALVILLVIGAIKSCSEPKNTMSRSESMCSDKGYAWVMAGNFVKRELKSPSSAKFPHQADQYTYLGECKHSIVGSVESENSFGAMLRTTFSVTMIYLPGTKKWRAEGLQIH